MKLLNKQKNLKLFFLLQNKKSQTITSIDTIYEP